MYSLPKFKIYEDEEDPEGVFEWGSSRNALFEEYYTASDLFFTGETEEAQSILENIIQQDPHFIGAHLLLGDIEMEGGSLEKALRYHHKALEVGDQIIPNTFKGKIRWGFIENRPFLKALHSVALDYSDQKKFKQSIQLHERLLDLNPNDNQGVRYLIGDLYFLNGDLQKAESVFKQNPDYPPYLYSYGLLQYSQQKPVDAISLLRKAILANVYISDFLRVKIPLIPYEIWHETNFEMPETAYPYIEMMTAKWMEFPGTLDLLQFLHVMEPSRFEIEQFYMLKNELYFTDPGLDPGEFDVREEILDEMNEIKGRITDQSSKQIYKEWNASPFSSRFGQ